MLLHIPEVLSQQDVREMFEQAFGRTPLKERLDDVLAQSLDLTRSPDLRKMREEAGDLLCSLLQLFNECGWDPAAQAAEYDIDGVVTALTHAARG